MGLLFEDRELELLVANANFGAAVEATNRELEPEGLYLTPIWGPEQQILTPEWKVSCRPVARDWGTQWLTVEVLGPLDLIVSKLCRADDGDLEDIWSLRVRSIFLTASRGDQVPAELWLSPFVTGSHLDGSVRASSSSIFSGGMPAVHPCKYGMMLHNCDHGRSPSETGRS